LPFHIKIKKKVEKTERRVEGDIKFARRPFSHSWLFRSQKTKILNQNIVGLMETSLGKERGEKKKGKNGKKFLYKVRLE
jgi:hypothetical protein